LYPACGPTDRIRILQQAAGELVNDGCRRKIAALADMLLPAGGPMIARYAGTADQ
jgi:hypothetical protein